MKSLVSLILLILSGITVTAQQTHYDIIAKIRGAEGVKFKLQLNTASGPVFIDSALVVKGILRMNSGRVEFPEYASLVAIEKKKGVSFFLENKKITLSGHIDSLNIAKITGSKTQAELYELQLLLKPLNDQAMTLVNEKKPVSEAILNAFKTAQKDFIRKNPGSFLSPHIMSNIINDLSVNEYDSILLAMDPMVAKSPVMMELKARFSILRVTALGQKAPDFTLNDVDGKPVSLASKIGPKLLLLDFWAAWCGPCRRENPFVVQTYNEFHGKGFDVFGVSLDRKKEDWVKAIADDKLTWTHVSDLQYFGSEAARLYGVNSIPSNFLLNDKGIIIAKNLRGEALYNKVSEVLGSN